MSLQLRVKVKSSVGAPGLTTEVSIPGPRTLNVLGKLIPKELGPNHGVEKTFHETWHDGDCYDLIAEGTLVIWPPEDRTFKECSLTVTSKINVGIIYCEKHGYWRIFVVATDDTGTNAPADVNVSIGPGEPDPSEEGE